MQEDTLEFLSSPSPTFPTLAQTWKSFPILRLRFSLRSKRLILPVFHGIFWHSVIGMGLHRSFPKTYHALWEKKGASLYTIQSPMVLKSFFDEGEILSFDLTLLGEGTHYALHCVEVIHEISLSGLGKVFPEGTRGTATLISVESVMPSAIVPVLQEGVARINVPTPFPASDIFSVRKKLQIDRITLFCESPLHLKTNNRVCVGAPEFSLILKRILGRMNQLAPTPFTLEKRILVDKSRKVDSGSHNISWCEIKRWSARQEKELLYGGIVGTLEYIGEITPFLPWLVLGQWLQIGNKTTFGFGTYQLAVDISGVCA